MLLALTIHLVVTVACAGLANRVGPKIFVLAALAPLSGVVLLVATMGQIPSGGARTEGFTWVGGLSLDVALRLDPLSWLMLILVSGVGSAIFLYTAWYAHRGPTLTRLAWTLTAFAGAMFGLVLADDVVMLYVFWELTTITSFLLVGLDDDSPVARAAARQALLITVLGGLSMLVGMLMLAAQVGSTRISDIVANPPSGELTQWAVGLVLLGAITKSAQVPFHIWLPGAMAAPTPVSAYLHAAAMVKAGIYLVARLAPAFAESIEWWRPTLVAFGIATMIVGGWRALRQHDLKTLTAYSTVSQLGFLMTVAAWGTPDAAMALTALLITHGMAKAALFMTVGVVDHAAHTRDLRRLDGLYRHMTLTATFAALAAASMAGIPLLVGFIAKEKVLAAVAYEDTVTATATLVGLVLGSALTVAYSLRLWWGAFGPRLRLNAEDYDAPPPGQDRIPATEVHAPQAGMVAPIAVLALVSLLLGVVPRLMDDLGTGNASPYAGAEKAHYALWHGLNAELGMSALAIGTGIALFWLRNPIAQLQRSFHHALPVALDANRGYDATLVGVREIALRVTGRTQTGSLPQYLAVIAVTSTAIPAAVALGRGASFAGIPLAQDAAQVVAGVFILATAAVTVAMRQRLAAALGFGAVGYAVALLFVIHGAPDLALTQFLVETLSVVVFLLVLRLLPRRFPEVSSHRAQALKAVAAMVVGLSMALLGLAAAGSRAGGGVAEGLVARSYSEAHGRNIVNVILVDFRGFDTFGEVTVVAIAAVGIATLVMTVNPDLARQREVPARGDATRQYSPILDIVVRIVFHTVLLVSAYFLMAGHNNPGGGFIGGLVAGAAFVMLYLTGHTNIRRILRISSLKVLSAGLILSSIAVLTPWLFGGQALQSAYLSGTTILGPFGLSSVLVFDTGVYLIVIGMVLILLTTFAARRDAGLAGSPESEDAPAGDVRSSG